MAHVFKSMVNVAKTTLWQSNESSHLNALRPYNLGLSTAISHSVNAQINDT